MRWRIACQLYIFIHLEGYDTQNTSQSLTHQLLEVRSECKVQDEPGIIESPELLDDGRPHVVVMDW